MNLGVGKVCAKVAGKRRLVLQRFVPQSFGAVAINLLVSLMPAKRQ